MIESGNPSVRKANTLLGLQFLSDFGDQISSALLALCLLDITQSVSKVGMVYFISTAGFVVFTLVGGAIGDRLSKKNILFCSDLARGFTVLLMIVALREKSIFLIYCTQFILSILGSINRPVRLGLWAESIPSQTLERYNSFSEASIQTSMILGPLIASFFMMKNLAGLGFAVDALTFFLCAIVFAQMAFSKEPVHTFHTSKDKSFLEGFSIILKRPDMSKYIAYDAIQMIGFGAFNATFLVLAQKDYGWSKGDYSYHLSIVAFFTTIGALMGATRFVARMDQSQKLIWCAVISAAAMGLVLRIQSFPLSSFLVGICDGLTVLTMAVTRTKVQLIAKNEHPSALSSILAARFIIIKAATLFGTATCLIIDDFINLTLTLSLYVIPIGLSCLPIALSRKDGTSAAVAVSAVAKTHK